MKEKEINHARYPNRRIVFVNTLLKEFRKYFFAIRIDVVTPIYHIQAMVNKPTDNRSSKDLAKPRSIRVNDTDWKKWEQRASERGLSISSWLHMLAADDIRKGGRENPSSRRKRS
jgi:hypothetical protein